MKRSEESRSCDHTFACTVEQHVRVCACVCTNIYGELYLERSSEIAHLSNCKKKDVVSNKTNKKNNNVQESCKIAAAFLKSIKWRHVSVAFTFLYIYIYICAGDIQLPSSTHCSFTLNEECHSKIRFLYFSICKTCKIFSALTATANDTVLKGSDSVQISFMYYSAEWKNKIRRNKA